MKDGKMQIKGETISLTREQKRYLKYANKAQLKQARAVAKKEIRLQHATQEYYQKEIDYINSLLR